jgi:hypothetical protein
LKKLSLLLLIIGFILNIGSWIVEHYFNSSLKDKIEYCETTQKLIASEALLMDNSYSNLYKEIKSVKIDTFLLIKYGEEYIQHCYNILAWESARIESDENKRKEICYFKDCQISEVLKYAKENNINKIIEICNMMTDFQAKTYDSLKKQFNSYYSDIQDKYIVNQRIFLVTYILGTVLIFITTVLKEYIFNTKKKHITKC